MHDFVLKSAHCSSSLDSKMVLFNQCMARRLDDSGAHTELVAAKDAEIARLRDTVGHLERRGDLFDARLLSFRAAESEYRAQVATKAMWSTAGWQARMSRVQPLVSGKRKEV